MESEQAESNVPFLDRWAAEGEALTAAIAHDREEIRSIRRQIYNQSTLLPLVSFAVTAFLLSGQAPELRDAARALSCGSMAP
jgi:hypothetical protein